MITASYTCEKHGNIGIQVLRLGVFKYDPDEYHQYDICGVCHSEMILKDCKIAKKKQEDNNDN